MFFREADAPSVCHSFFFHALLPNGYTYLPIHTVFGEVAFLVTKQLTVVTSMVVREEKSFHVLYTFPSVILQLLFSACSQGSHPVYLTLIHLSAFKAACYAQETSIFTDASQPLVFEYSSSYLVRKKIQLRGRQK